MVTHSQACQFHMKLPHRAACPRKPLRLWFILFVTLVLSIAGCAFLAVGQVLPGALLVLTAFMLLAMAAIIFLVRGRCALPWHVTETLPQNDTIPSQRPTFCQLVETTPQSLCENRALHAILARDAQRRLDEISDDVAISSTTHVRF
jgi:hypothetical protein